MERGEVEEVDVFSIGSAWSVPEQDWEEDPVQSAKAGWKMSREELKKALALDYDVALTRRIK